MRYFLIAFLFFFSYTSSAQVVKYNGNIFSDADNKPVNGVSLVALPSGARTLSKQDGSFELTVMARDKAITIEHLGYRCIAVEIGSKLDSIILERREMQVPGIYMYLHEQEKGVGEVDYHEFNKLGFHAGFKFGTKSLRSKLTEIIGKDSSFNKNTPALWVKFAINKEGLLEDLTLNPADSPVGDLVRNYFNSIKKSWLPAKFGGTGFKEYFSMPIQFDPTFTKIDEPAVFPGDDDAFETYVKENISLPSALLKDGETGRVFLSFDVEKDGSITSIKVTRGINTFFDHEAVRLMKQSPKWIPGKHKGEIVRFRTSKAVIF